MTHENKLCAHCGVPFSHADSQGIWVCMPPFKLQPHDFQAPHPSETTVNQNNTNHPTDNDLGLPINPDGTSTAKSPLEKGWDALAEYAKTERPRRTVNLPESQRIYNSPNHPQYGPVRRMFIILTQLDMLDWLDRQYSQNRFTWDTELAAHIAAHNQRESATFMFYLNAWLYSSTMFPEWQERMAELDR